MKEIKRVFEYHGAEHKVIHCYEHEEELTVENARKYTTLHPLWNSLSVDSHGNQHPCFSFLKWDNIMLRVDKVATAPFVAGVSYEIINGREPAIPAWLI